MILYCEEDITYKNYKIISDKSKEEILYTLENWWYEDMGGIDELEEYIKENLEETYEKTEGYTYWR